MTIDPITAARALIEPLTGYTSGPWDAVLERGCHGVIAQTLPEGGANFVALIGNDTDTIEKEPSRFANARLIAAAPDLHAHLTAALNEIDRLRSARARAKIPVNIETFDASKAEDISGLATAPNLRDMVATLADALEAERAENQRLREALKRIANCREDAHAHDDDMGHLRRVFDVETVMFMEAMARAALNGEGET